MKPPVLDCPKPACLRQSQAGRFWTVALALGLACAGAPPPPPAAPPPTDIESLIGARPPLPEIPPGLPDGPDRSVGKNDCRGLPAGLWVSERKFAERIAAVAERDRLRREVDAYVKLHRLEREIAADVEQATRQQLGEADRRAERRLWYGIAAGAGAVLVGAFALRQVGN